MTSVPELARPDEVEQISDLFMSAFHDYAQRLGRDMAGPYDWIDQMIADERIYVLRQDKALIAGLRLSDAPEDNVMTLDILAVAPTFARQGIGSQLLAWFDAHARAKGRSVVKLYTAEMMTHLVAFYHRNGYETVRIGPPEHGKDAHMRVFMQKILTPVAPDASGAEQVENGGDQP